jgi:hypothetical protein
MTSVGLEERVTGVQDGFVAAVDLETDGSGDHRADDVARVMVGAGGLAGRQLDSGELRAFDRGRGIESGDE